jgi:hypothetical protein
LWWAVFEKLPSDNAYGPVWSPDCAHLLFRIYTGDHWRLGLIGTDGSGFQFVGEISPANQWQIPANLTAQSLCVGSLLAQRSKYLFTSTVDGRHFGIYKLSLTGKSPQLVVSNASSVTVSAR